MLGKKVGLVTAPWVGRPPEEDKDHGRGTRGGREAARSEWTEVPKPLPMRRRVAL